MKAKDLKDKTAKLTPIEIDECPEWNPVKVLFIDSENVHIEDEKGKWLIIQKSNLDIE